MKRQAWQTQRSGSNSNSYYDSEQDFENNMKKSFSQKQDFHSKYFNPINIKQYTESHQFKKKSFQQEFVYKSQGFNNEIISNGYPLRSNFQKDKNCSGTKYQTQNESLFYQEQAQPSFAKDSFGIVDDIGLNLFSPIKPMQKILQKGKGQDNKSSYYINGKKDSSKVNKKLFKLIQQLHQVKFMKEGISSKISQFKNKFNDQIVQIKKVLFRLGIKLEKDLIDYSRNEQRLSKAHQISNQIKGDRFILNDQACLKQIQKLKSINFRLEQDKVQLKKRFETTLHSYQDQFQKMGQIIAQKVQESRLNQKCKNCQTIKKQQNLGSYQIEIWKDRLKQQQQRHAKGMKSLQQKVLMLQEEFVCLEQSKSLNEQKFRNKQREMTYRQSQVQLKMRQIQQKQRDLQIVQRMLQKQRDQLRKKQEKISDLEFRNMRQERKNKQKQKQKEIMSSEYFNNSQKRRILSKGQLNTDRQRERSNSRSSRGSKIDINLRLRQIAQMKNRGQANYQSNYERASSRENYKEIYSPRSKNLVSLPRGASNKKISQYGSLTSLKMQPNQYSKQTKGQILLNQKLQSLTMTIQKQLNEMK